MGTRHCNKIVDPARRPSIHQVRHGSVRFILRSAAAALPYFLLAVLTVFYDWKVPYTVAIGTKSDRIRVHSFHKVWDPDLHKNDPDAESNHPNDWYFSLR